MTTAQATMTAKVSNVSTAQLCEMFELTNGKSGVEFEIVRGCIMDELERRNPAAFESWMLSDLIDSMDKPSHFYV